MLYYRVVKLAWYKNKIKTNLTLKRASFLQLNCFMSSASIDFVLQFVLQKCFYSSEIERL